MYKIGETVMYRSNGLCEVEAIGTLCFSANREQEYYTLRPLSGTGNTHVYVPVNADVLHSVITKEEALRYLEQLPQLPVSSYSSKIKKASQLAAYYKEMLKSDDLTEHLKLFKELSEKEHQAKVRGRRLGEQDSNYKKLVEQLLIDEFFYALKESTEKTRTRFRQALDLAESIA